MGRSGDGEIGRWGDREIETERLRNREIGRHCLCRKTFKIGKAAW